MLPFSLVELPRGSGAFPLYPYSAGRHIQYHHVRPGGFPVHQVFLIHSGQGLFRDLADGSETVLGPGMVFAFPPDRGHEYYPLSHEPWRVGFIGIYGPEASPVLHTLGLLPSSPSLPADFKDCWEAIGDIWHKANGHNTGQSELSAILYRLLLLLRPAEQTAGAPERPEAGTVRNEALQQAVSLINTHYTEPLLVANLAAAVGYSVQHFQRLFLQEFGVTPHKYLQNLRLTRALQLMEENPELPIQEIALNLGMESSYFIRLFRKTYGCTPGEMRSNMTKGER
ncbi:helix-turn-helix transcriptional regulator [Paenibacillus tengchongensis]|uniref:helix-turn-helix transcriptional regulator n=1 Tax=Paenibacillus tengchongensis TaxID=2608684 RepID=UPI00124C17E6|nr:AraC family transcriptional regulator [Paenibacillus tengchongensis]